jgi:hypothetical protein
MRESVCLCVHMIVCVFVCVVCVGAFTGGHQGQLHNRFNLGMFLCNIVCVHVCVHVCVFLLYWTFSTCILVNTSGSPQLIAAVPGGDQTNHHAIPPATVESPLVLSGYISTKERVCVCNSRRVCVFIMLPLLFRGGSTTTPESATSSTKPYEVIVRLA